MPILRNAGAARPARPSSNSFTFPTQASVYRITDPNATNYVYDNDTEEDINGLFSPLSPDVFSGGIEELVVVHEEAPYDGEDYGSAETNTAHGDGGDAREPVPKHLRVARTYLIDAVKGRPPQVRVQEEGTLFPCCASRRRIASAAACRTAVNDSSSINNLGIQSAMNHSSDPRTSAAVGGAGTGHAMPSVFLPQTGNGGGRANPSGKSANAIVKSGDAMFGDHSNGASSHEYVAMSDDGCAPAPINSSSGPQQQSSNYAYQYDDEDESGGAATYASTSMYPGPSPLAVYDMLHNRWWRRLGASLAAVHMCIGLFEYADSHALRQAMTYLELGILFFLLVEARLWAFCHDPEVARPLCPSLCSARVCAAPTWASAQVLAIVLTLADMAVWLTVPAYHDSNVRVSRLIRPFFMIERGRVLRKMVTVIAHTFSSVFEVVTLIAVTILSFAFLGFFLFSKNALAIGPNPNFENFEISAYSMTILLTTANFPDVMMDSYSAANWTALYFIIYLLIALYLMFNLILAAVYTRFQERAQDIVAEVPKIQTMCLCAAFELLVLSDPQACALAAEEAVRHGEAEAKAKGRAYLDRGRGVSVSYNQRAANNSTNAPNANEDGGDDDAGLLQPGLYNPAPAGKAGANGKQYNGSGGQGVGVKAGSIGKSAAAIAGGGLPPLLARASSHNSSSPGSGNGAAGGLGLTVSTTSANAANAIAAKKHQWSLLQTESTLLEHRAVVRSLRSGSVTAAALAATAAAVNNSNAYGIGGSGSRGGSRRHSVNGVVANSGNIGPDGGNNDATASSGGVRRRGANKTPRSALSNSPSSPQPAGKNCNGECDCDTSSGNCGCGSEHDSDEDEDDDEDDDDDDLAIIARNGISINNSNGIATGAVAGVALPGFGMRLGQGLAGSLRSSSNNSPLMSHGAEAAVDAGVRVVGIHGLSLDTSPIAQSGSKSKNGKSKTRSAAKNKGVAVSELQALPAPDAGAAAESNSVGDSRNLASLSAAHGSNAILRTFLDSRALTSPDSILELDYLAHARITKPLFHRFLRYVRPTLTVEQIDIIFNAMDITHTGSLDAREWVRLCDYIDVQFRQQHRPPPPPSQQQRSQQQSQQQSQQTQQSQGRDQQQAQQTQSKKQKQKQKQHDGYQKQVDDSADVGNTDDASANPTRVVGGTAHFASPWAPAHGSNASANAESKTDIVSAATKTAGGGDINAPVVLNSSRIRSSRVPKHTSVLAAADAAGTAAAAAAAANGSATTVNATGGDDRSVQVTAGTDTYTSSGAPYTGGYLRDSSPSPSPSSLSASSSYVGGGRYHHCNNGVGALGAEIADGSGTGDGGLVNALSYAKDGRGGNNAPAGNGGNALPRVVSAVNANTVTTLNSKSSSITGRRNAQTPVPPYATAGVRSGNISSDPNSNNSRDLVLAAHGHRKHRSTDDQVCGAARRRVRHVVRLSAFEACIDAVVVVHAVYITLHLEGVLPRPKVLDAVGAVLLGWYVVEMVLKMYSYGPSRYWGLGLVSKLDLCVVTASVVLGLAKAGGAAVNPRLWDLPLLRVFRIIRHLLRFAGLRAIISTVKGVWPALRTLAMILFGCFYFFAMLGIFLFRNLIAQGKMDEDFMKTYYANNNYWENNFNDLTHALVTLFEIQIINNWNLTVEGFTVAMKAHWPRVFFVCFFFCTVVVLMNVVVALLLEAFVARYTHPGGTPDALELDSAERDALTRAMQAYSAQRTSSGNSGGIVNNSPAIESPGLGDGSNAAVDGSGAGAGAADGNYAEMWKIVLKKRTQRNYKLIFDPRA